MWTTSRTVSESLAADVGYKGSNEVTDFEWLYDAIRTRRKTSDAKTLEILSQRMANESVNEHNYKKVLEIGDAVNVLEESDANLAEDEKVQEERKQNHTMFVNEFSGNVFGGETQ